VESEGGQKFFLPRLAEALAKRANPLPFCPPERRQFRSKKVRISSNKRTNRNFSILFSNNLGNQY